MSIVFSAITPHLPILIPSIGKKNLNQTKNTQDAYKELEQNLYTSKTETIIIFSSHGAVQNNVFTINLASKFQIHFKNFGDLSSKLSIAGDIGLGCQIKETLESENPLQLINEQNLDYGSGVPLYLLVKNLPNIKIIPIHYSNLDLESHFKFGQFLKQELLISEKRIAIIASSDLSHQAAEDFSVKYFAKSAKFDQKIIECLKNKNIQNIFNINPELIKKSCECGLKSIIMLLGVLNNIEYEPQLLSYEKLFGVGCLTMNFKFS
ncbi:MAG: AmmeMemoRadiSam system protein B [Patescibacteria group bacterium]|nr:AmmeMemoRadiSam system protein B [Patescibacteria group bacterium]MBU1421418.1 AmmeMemoRadiSam system protein B [Patescibacteria group bacterium]MBU1684342.1 AmmeMemoRadiSam system protein B [Patescibacteria group bacterium]MBU1778401.1 AmmeMemoRadiSam system protein B [Patescibacteria group bacterium]MBU1987132.1 AmmeMemoRadiSam system protein B [Patescibacteria group bacterium]